MHFQLTPWMLMPLAIGIFASVILLNRQKVHEINERWDERLNLPKPFQTTYKDPKGRRDAVGAVGMLIMSVLAIIGLAKGFIEAECRWQRGPHRVTH